MIRSMRSMISRCLLEIGGDVPDCPARISDVVMLHPLLDPTKKFDRALPLVAKTGERVTVGPVLAGHEASIIQVSDARIVDLPLRPF